MEPTNEDLSYETYDDMIGKTFTSVHDGTHYLNDALIFESDDGGYVFCHSQDCCESVRIEQIDGDLEDLQGSPLIIAEEASHRGSGNYDEEWTFYRFATTKGYVTVRFYGVSNGYYSTAVSRKYIAGKSVQS